MRKIKWALSAFVIVALLSSCSAGGISAQTDPDTDQHENVSGGDVIDTKPVETTEATDGALTNTEISEIKKTCLCLNGTLLKYEKTTYFIVESENEFLSKQEKVRVCSKNKDITFEDCSDGDKVMLWVGMVLETLPPGVDVLYYEKVE